MGKVRFKRGLRFWLGNTEYVINKRLNENDFQICNATTEELSGISEDALIKAFFEGRLSFDPPAKINDTNRKDFRYADFSQVDDDLKDDAKRRFKYVKEYFDQGLQKRTKEVLEPVITKVANIIGDKQPPSWATLYRWIKRYESQESDIRSLIAKNIAKGNRRSRLDSEIIQIINEVIDEYYLTLEKGFVA